MVEAGDLDSGGVPGPVDRELIDYHTLLGQVPVLYALSVATLMATYAVGMTAFGSRRWIGTASYHLQVSEFVKLVIVLLVARYLTELKTEHLELHDLLKLGGPGWFAHGDGDAPAGPGYGSDLSSDPGGRCFPGRVPLAIRGGRCRGHCAGCSRSVIGLC